MVASPRGPRDRVTLKERTAAAAALAKTSGKIVQAPVVGKPGQPPKAPSSTAKAEASSSSIQPARGKSVSAGASIVPDASSGSVTKPIAAVKSSMRKTSSTSDLALKPVVRKASTTESNLKPIRTKIPPSALLASAVNFPLDKKRLGTLGLRQWVKILPGGNLIKVKAEKQAITHELGINLRDLRILDPQMSSSYPSALLCRDKAMIFNMEELRCIIAVDHVLVLDVPHETVATFISETQKRLWMPVERHSLAHSSSMPSINLHEMIQQQQQQQQPLLPKLGPPAAGAPKPWQSGEAFFAADAPFELRVLEVALDVTCAALERSTLSLEALTNPLVDKLAVQVDKTSLERLRGLKGRMVRLSSKVETIREVLEALLDDDDDMKDMTLTANRKTDLERQSLQRQFSGLPIARLSAGLEEGLVLPSREGSWAEEPHPLEAALAEGKGDQMKVEMLLETHFMHIDNTWNKLEIMNEVLHDTETFANYEINHTRNGLIRMRMLVSAAALLAWVIFGLAGTLTVNVTNNIGLNGDLCPGPDQGNSTPECLAKSHTTWLMVTITSVSGSVGMMLGFLFFCKKMNYLYT